MSEGEGRVCRHKGDRGECLAPDCNCPPRAVPAPSDEAVRAAAAKINRFGWPYREKSKGVAEVMLPAAYAIDLPRVRAEERAATLREVTTDLETWIEAKRPKSGDGVLGEFANGASFALDRLSEKLAEFAHFNPEAEDGKTA